MKTMANKRILLLSLLLFAVSVYTAGADQRDLGKRLVFYPGLKAGERKDFTIYLGPSGAPAQKGTSGIECARNADSGATVNNGVLKVVLGPTGCITSLGFANGGASKIVVNKLVAPDLLYNPGTGLARLYAKADNISVIDGPAALQVVATGKYAQSGHQWRRSYLFFKGDYFRVEDTFNAMENPPADFKSNILFSSTTLAIGSDPGENLLAWQDLARQVSSGIKVEDPTKDSMVVPFKWANLGTWSAVYSPKENIALGNIFSTKSFAMQSISYEARRKLFSVVDSLDVPVEKGKVISVGQYVTLKNGGYKPVQELAGVLTEPVAYRVSALDEKAYSEGGFSWTHRIKLSLNNYMESDRKDEPLFIPLDKLGVDWSKFSPQSVRIAASEAGGREAFLPCQVVE